MLIMKKIILIFSLIVFNILNAQTDNWVNYTCTYKIYDMTAVGDRLWLSTIGGGVTIDQNTGQVKHYNRANTDLPDIFLRGMSVADNGNLWFDVSQYGMSKFDGISWYSYTIDNSSIPDQNIVNVSENVNGEVWMKSYNINSLIRFDGNSWTIFNSNNSGLPNEFQKFVFDSSGALWIITNQHGLVRFDGVNTTIFNINNSQIPSNQINDIVIDENDNIWISTEYGLTKFNGQNWTTYNTNNSSIPLDRIMNLEIHNNEVWGIWRVFASQESGLFMFDGTNWHNYNTTNSSLPNGLHGNLQITSNGDKWLLTGSWPHSEVIQFKDSATVYHDISNSPLMGNHVSDIDIDDDGKMWIADHGNIAYRGQLISYKDYNWEAYGQETSVGWVAIQNDSVKWMGMYNRIGRFENGITTIYNTLNSGLPSNTINAATVDSIGNMWFATPEGLCKYDGLNWVVYDSTNSIIPHTWMSDIAVDSFNNIWLGINGLGVIKFDGTSWVEYTITNSGLGSNAVKNLEFDRHGNLWIGTSNNGVTKFDGANWTVYNSSNAIIPLDNVLALGFDNQNHLWIGTWKGASYFDGSNWILFSTDNSNLPHNVVNDFEFDEYGNVWIGTGGGGIGVYNPNGVNLSIYENSLKTEDYKISVYPVPFNDKLNIEIEKSLVGSSLVLYDITGRNVGVFELNEVSNEIVPMLNEKGIYLYTIVNGKGVVGQGKLIRE